MKKMEINKLIQGDCLNKMQPMPEKSIDLIYLDPPFFSQKEHRLKNKERDKEFYFEDIWAKEKDYAFFLHSRFREMHRILKKQGSIFVHCDKNAAHIVRHLLNEVFGASNFQSEIIWRYKRWSNSKKGLLPNHQNIYFYSKTKKFTFNKLFTPYSETTNIDQILQKRTRDRHNKSIYQTTESGTYKIGKPKQGVPLGDVWDIPYLNPRAKERVGYPTQKPLILLERIIELTSKQGDIVLDPFCGSGTTCVAAKRLGRSFIGIDRSEAAIKLAEQRLAFSVKTESNVLKKGRAAYINLKPEILKLLKDLEAHPVQRNKGIDAILKEHFAGKPVFIRVQREHESLQEAASLLAKAMARKQSQRSILIQTKANEKSSLQHSGIKLLKTASLQINEWLKE